MSPSSSSNRAPAKSNQPDSSGDSRRARFYNPSRWTQTILGPGVGFFRPNGPYAQLSVGDSLNIRGGGGVFRPVSYVLPGTIPPHQIRAVRVMWTSTTCLEKGSDQGINRLSLRVRVGWITRTEVIRLNQVWALSGPSQGRCT